MLRATLKHEQDIAILQYSGDLTEETGGMLPGLQDALARGERKIILDLAEVRYVNSAGLSTFVDSYKAGLRADAKMALCQLQPAVLKVFKLARVEIFIPIYDTLGQAFKHFGVMQAAAAEGPPREQLLVIEPGLTIGDEIQRLLAAQKEQLNYRLSRVPNVVEAVRFLEVRTTHVILLDIEIPRADAERFIGQVKSNTQQRHIPIIIVTRDPQIPDADFLVRNGADDMLRVPLVAYEVSARLRVALALHYAMQKDDSNVSRLFETRLTAGKYEGPKYPTLR
ncbi:MAG: hypothetical protein GEEBNDBF_02186 [bacterium]|nr:hypothetical protein [bacterium]